MPTQFLENPFIEKRLRFDFGPSAGATRYERWPSHLGKWQKTGKKAVDFIYPDEGGRNLYFTEIKDYATITQSGRAGQGTYSEKLAKMVARKAKDSIAGFGLAEQSENVEEHEFHAAFKGYAFRIVFHWEFKYSVKQPKRKLQMMQMKGKLRELLQGVCTHVVVENIGDFPSTHWTVRRIGRTAQ